MIKPQNLASKDHHVSRREKTSNDSPHASNQNGDAPVTGAPAVRMIDAAHESPPPRRRSAWRETLVRAERGLVGGFRGGSELVVHLFGISIVIAAALVLGMETMHWIAIAGCLTLVLTAELFNQALKALASAGDGPAPPHVLRALAIGTAAVLVACVGSTIILTLIFWQRFQQLFAG
jgi:undecaprenol kinase/diacylglycerol kinase (ATP)